MWASRIASLVILLAGVMFGVFVYRIAPLPSEQVPGWQVIALLSGLGVSLWFMVAGVGGIVATYILTLSDSGHMVLKPGWEKSKILREINVLLSPDEGFCHYATRLGSRICSSIVIGLVVLIIFAALLFTGYSHIRKGVDLYLALSVVTLAAVFIGAVWMINSSWEKRQERIYRMSPAERDAHRLRIETRSDNVIATLQKIVAVCGAAAVLGMLAYGAYKYPHEAAAVAVLCGAAALIVIARIALKQSELYRKICPTAPPKQG